MENKILLCGHTGSINRGCEAILRSTVYILKQCGYKSVSALTFDENYDKLLGMDQDLHLIPYPQRNIIERGICHMMRTAFHNGMWGGRNVYKKIVNSLEPGTITFNVGGDTYCYGVPYLSFALNELTTNKGISNIFWGCSVDDHALKSAAMQKDLNLYKKIVVRESLSEVILRQIVQDQSKIVRACDPAFQLPIKKTQLPGGFQEGNTLGINVSPLVFEDYHDSNDMMRRNISKLIKWILAETDMQICLIPHVYNVQKNLQDIGVLGTIYNEFSLSDRVSIVNRELSCCELKYIIQKCRFFIGARTHSAIAAYSTGVPTIAISYSIKSRGIAKDLFGTEEGYAIPWKNISSENEIKNAFITCLYEKESEIRKHYAENISEYKQSIIDAVKSMLSQK